FARHVAPLLTNMPLDQLAVLGGVQFVHAQTNEVIWELTRPIYTNAATVPELADWARSLLALVDKARSQELEPTIAAEWSCSSPGSSYSSTTSSGYRPT